MILVGCPVFRRGFILPTWFQRIKSQDIDTKDIGFVFVISSGDEDTEAALFRFQADNPGYACFDVVYEDNVTHQEHRVADDKLYHRNWTNHTALTRMVLLRNTLLNRVREISPDHFFSLDSDILLEDKDTISKLCDKKVDAISPLAYMSETTEFPNVMSWKHYGPHYREMAMATRSKSEDTFSKVDVIMAAKMMSPDAYSVDYAYHPQGEDLGWSWNCRNKGLELYSDKSIYASHLLSEKMFDLYKIFGDFRK